jgi:hypothetical protein
VTVSKRVEVRELSERAMVKPDRHHQDRSDIKPRAVSLRYCGRTMRASNKKGEPCCMSSSHAGELRVSDSELNITLFPLSSPHRTLAAQALCGDPQQTAMTFPASRLQVRFLMRPPRRIGLAFLGSPVERDTVTNVTPILIGTETGHFGATLCQEL